MYNIAIDGPSGAGKSTIAKKLSKDLGFIYVDTGAMYRALALYFINKNFDIENQELVKRELENISIDIKYDKGKQLVFLNDKDVGEEIRNERVGGVASAVSVYPFVREKLLDLQRDVARKNHVVMDGRDIGSFVLPDADLKIFLSASVETRAGRRYLEMKEKGARVTLEDIKKDIETRDYRDMNRDMAPLKRVSDAVFIDSSELTIEEVVEEIKKYIEL